MAELLAELEVVLLVLLLRLFLVELRSLLADFFSFFGDVSSCLKLGDFNSFLMLVEFSSFLMSKDLLLLSVLGEPDECRRSVLTRVFIASLASSVSSLIVGVSDFSSPSDKSELE